MACKDNDCKFKPKCDCGCDDKGALKKEDIEHTVEGKPVLKITE